MKVNLNYLKSLFLFLPIITYTPFFFNQLINSYLRIGYFLLASIFLFCSSSKFSKNDIYVILSMISFILIISLSIQSSIDSVLSAGNYCLTLIFGWSLYRYLSVSSDRIKISLNFYVGFFYLVVIFSLISLIFLMTIGEYDLFGFKSDVYTQLVTPFGVHFKRAIGDITMYRSFFYFVEAAHIAIFYAANIIIVAPLLKRGSQKFIKLNLLGGILSVSVTFYVALLFLYIIKRTKSLSNIIFFSIGILILFILSQAFELVGYTSSDDRTERFLIFFLLMEQATPFQLLFGHGVSFETDFEKAFNSGLTLSIFETGIIGTLIQLLILILLCPNILIFSFFFFSSLVVDPIHMPIFWFVIIIAYHAHQKEMVNNLYKNE